MESRGWPFCFIGGLAVIRWGEIRATRYSDLCILCGFGNEEKYIHGFLKRYQPRIPDAATFAQHNRVLLLYADNKVPLDISLSGLVFEEEMIRRASQYAYTPEISLITCSAEDLIILKAFADRPKDWGDVESILARQKHHLDEDYIVNRLTPLCDLKEQPEIVAGLRKMLQPLD